MKGNISFLGSTNCHASQGPPSEQQPWKKKHFQRTSHVKKKTPQLYAACKWSFSPAFPEVCHKHVVPAVTSNFPWQNSCRSLKAPGWHRSCLAITQRWSKDLKVVRRAPGRACYSSAARSKGKINTLLAAGPGLGVHRPPHPLVPWTAPSGAWKLVL